MRAKFINEIKKVTSGSGWGALGVGTARVTRLYDKLCQNWPDAIDNMFNLTHNSSNYITSMAYKAAEILDCDVNQIKYLHVWFASDKLLDRWIETLIELSHIEPIVLDGEEYRNYDEPYTKTTITIDPLPDWDCVVVTKKVFYENPTTQVIYLIKTPLR